MMNENIIKICDQLGNNKILVALSCKRLIDNDRQSVILADVKSVRRKKTNYIKIVAIDDNKVILKFYKVVYKKSLEILDEFEVEYEKIPQIIEENTGIDIS